jgi:hypothetical protein
MTRKPGDLPPLLFLLPERGVSWKEVPYAFIQASLPDAHFPSFPFPALFVIA